MTATRRPGARPGGSHERIVITMPAYNAEATLAKTIADIPPGSADQLILVDDASPDNTAQLARELGLDVYVHPENRGYGGNQKTCYTTALASGADVVVMLHPDYQYEPRAVPLLLAPILAGDADMTFGSRFAGLSDPLGGGMPLVRYVGNRATTIVENLLLGSRFSEMHSGMRAYTRRCLLSLPFLRYSDDFLFDSQFLIDAVTSGARVIEVPIPTRYTDESSSIGMLRSVSYVTRSLGYCTRRVWEHGRRAHRSPVGRHAEDRTEGEAPPSEIEAACVLCGVVGPQETVEAGRIQVCKACGLVASTAPRSGRATRAPAPRDVLAWAVHAASGYATGPTRVVQVGENELPTALGAAGWRTELPARADDSHRVDALLGLTPPVTGMDKAPGLVAGRRLLTDEALLAFVAPVARLAAPRLDPGVPFGMTARPLQRALDAAGFELVEWCRAPRDVADAYLRWLSGGGIRSGGHEMAFVAARASAVRA